MYLASLAELALGSRLKALSDRFHAAADEVYRVCGAEIELRRFPLMRYLKEAGAGHGHRRRHSDRADPFGGKPAGRQTGA